VLVLTSLGVWGMPQMVQKFYAIKSTDAIKRGAIISTLFAVVIAGGCYFLGGFGRLAAKSIELVPDKDIPGKLVPASYDAVVPAMLQGMPDLLMGLLVVLVLSASMSTLSALVMTSSSTLTLDFLKGKFIREMDVRSQIMAIRLLIVVFVLISTVIAIVQYNSQITFIAQLMAISWGVLAGSFLGPFLYGLYWKRTTVASVWACFIFAVLLVCGSMALNYMKLVKLSLINVGALAILSGLVIVPVVSLLTKRPDPEKTNALFRESYLNLHDTKIDAD